MRLLMFALMVCIAFSGVSYSKEQFELFGGSPGHEEAILSTTLSHLNLKDPGQDAKEHVASGDLRPVGLNGYTCSVPVPKGNSLTSKVGIRCLDGTSDVIEGQEHRHLIEVARTYAIAYNQALDLLVDAKK